ncbi:rhodanese-like domain-containing protein [Verminephrobacter eiseniae]|nr:rhodanese-like domain-containing protein [Verminephrobacter eiseniae]MCW8183616.1 rhodanese-like domain-containing protein [Verminephrobacter eiseniae]MCW8223378.1 rhodanese-like domain-containing protein [Verminephrobacter eiseniae]MCW8233399.1 rhodanese-like domain-containing protein [Verminephrobacter eiseniae]
MTAHETAPFGPGRRRESSQYLQGSLRLAPCPDTKRSDFIWCSHWRGGTSAALQSPQKPPIGQHSPIRQQEAQGMKKCMAMLAVAMAMALLCQAGLARAPLDSLPPALADIPAAAGICRRDLAAVVSVGPAVRYAAVLDPACSVAAPDIQPGLADTDMAWIDVRPPMDFREFHIEGALNLSATDLYAKPYWRKKRVLLVGSGKAQHELHRQCTRLKQAGYDRVHVLRGGMALWVAQDRPVTGRMPPAARLARLSAAELWLESRNPDNLILLAPEQSALQSELGSAQQLAALDEESIRLLLGKRKKALPKAAPMAVVLVANLPDVQIRQIQRAIMPTPLLVYGDSRAAFVQQMTTHQAMWMAQARGPRQPVCGL